MNTTETEPTEEKPDEIQQAFEGTIRPTEPSKLRRRKIQSVEIA